MKKTKVEYACGEMSAVNATSARAEIRLLHSSDASTFGRMLGDEVAITRVFALRRLADERNALRDALEQLLRVENEGNQPGDPHDYRRRMNAAWDAARAAIADDSIPAASPPDFIGAA